MFNRIFAELAAKGGQARPADDRRDPPQGAPDRGKPAKKGALPRRIGRTKGGLNSKLHAVCDDQGRPLVMLLSEGQMSDYKGAALMLDAFRDAKAPARRQGLRCRLVPCTLWPSAASPPASRQSPTARCRSRTIPTLYRQRHKIENMFGRLKDWRRIHTRYDRCAHTFMSAICIAATVIFWL